jgi:sulfonate transport system substrate-binding protein
MPFVERLDGVKAVAARCALMIAAAAIGCSKAPGGPHGDDTTSRAQILRIGRAKQLISLAVLEKTGALERRLRAEGFEVQWPEFAAGPQQLEALNAGSLEIAQTAESPVIFAQAAGAPVVYLVTMHPSGKAVSLLVPTDSRARSIADLKGKKVACQKASIGHYLLIRGLQQVGLTPRDVEWIFLPPPDAAVAFTQKRVDAWFIWEPFVARAVEGGVGRVLMDGEALKDSGNFYTTRRAFAEAHADVLRIFLEELDRAESWSRDHPHEMAELLSPSIQVDVPTLERMHAEYTFGFVPISDAVIARQQRIADGWYELGSLPGRVNVRDGVLPAEFYQEVLPLDLREAEGARP